MMKIDKILPNKLTHFIILWNKNLLVKHIKSNDKHIFTFNNFYFLFKEDLKLKMSIQSKLDKYNRKLLKKNKDSNNRNKKKSNSNWK